MGQFKHTDSSDTQTLKSIKTSRKLPDGIYIRGSVQGYPILFTADTGASKTVVSKRMYEAMEVEDRPALSSSSRLIGPGGSIIKELGKGNFSLKLGNIEVQVEAVVAEIDDDGLLGIDVLQNDKDGPADILLSKGVLMVQDKAVPMIQIGLENRVRKVVSADHYVIPPMAESVIDVFVERHDYDDFSGESECLIESTDRLKEAYPFQMGTPKMLFEQENQTEKNNFFRVRRIDIATKSDNLIVDMNKSDSKEVSRVTSQHREQEYQVRKGSELSGPSGSDLPGPSTSDRSEASLIGGDESHNLTSTTVGIISADEFRRYQNEDQDLALMVQSKSVGVKPSRQDMVTKSPACRHYCILWDSLVLLNGILYKKFLKRDGTGEYLQLLVPSALKKDILCQMHNSLLAGHLGRKKTKQKTLQRYYWYNLKEDVNLHIHKCDVCEADKKPNKVPRAALGSLPAGAPGDCLATDYLGPFPVTAQGNRYILLLTDHFSKFVEIIPVPDMTAEVCASKILNEYISRWGCPLSIHSDQGRTYESKVFKELCRMLEISKTRTSVRNPKGNGQSERFNRTLLRMIKAYLCDEQEEWDLHLGCLAGAYRATPHEATKMTPNLMTMGREVRLPAELVFGSSSTPQGDDITSYGDYVDLLRSRMQHAHEVARKYLGMSAKRSKDNYDTKVAVNRFEKGDYVWCLNEARKVGVAPKLQHTYHGPFLVLEKVNDANFVIQMDKDGKKVLLHHDKLKPYEGENPPKWLARSRKKLMQ